ncbi:MAG: hypothetical protein ACQES9_10655 [Myxococcota bacterium]
MNRQNEAQKKMVKGFLFDLSSDERTIRVGAIRGLINFATAEGVEEAVKQRIPHEKDPVCLQGLEEILRICGQKSDKVKFRLVDRTSNKAAPSPVSSNSVSIKPKLENQRQKPVENKFNRTSSGISNEPLQGKTDDSSLNVKESDAGNNDLSAMTAKATETQLNWKLRLKNMLDWAGRNDLRVSEPGATIIGIVLVCFVAFISYNLVGTDKRYTSGTRARGSLPAKKQNPGAIQTTDLSPGESLKGTLKEYNIFGQSWLFLSDDDRLFRLKLGVSPSFFRVEEKVKVKVESCEKNSLGHTVIIGKVE